MRVVTSFHMWQRINIAAYMVWIAVLAITLLRSRAPAGRPELDPFQESIANWRICRPPACRTVSSSGVLHSQHAGSGEPCFEPRGAKPGNNGADGASRGPAGHHLRSGAWLGDECESDTGPGRALLHAGQPVSVRPYVLDVKADPVIGHHQPDRSSMLEGEFHVDPPRAAVTRRVGQRCAGDAGQGRLD